MDKDKIKKELTEEQIYQLLNDFGGEPQMKDDCIVSKTICHGGSSHKLYYYFNSRLFRCYTDCDDSWDIFDLVKKVKSREENTEWSLYDSIQYVKAYFGYETYSAFPSLNNSKLEDWKIFDKKQNRISYQKKIIELKYYDDDILRFLPSPRINVWEREGINSEIIKRANIKYNPVSSGIVIPHYDINNKLIGIRERTLIKENEQYGKYKPAILSGKMYNHPLSFALYNLNFSKTAISKFKKAIVFESEKSCLKYASLVGKDNDISVAVCGSNLILYQIQLLLSLGVNEIIVAFDRQYKEIGDEEYLRWIAKLKNISQKYKKYCNISFLFDTDNCLDYKESPIDRDTKTFIKLYNERLNSEGVKYE